MAWHQISVITDEDTAPKVADYFSDFGAVSVTYMDAEDEPVYEPALNETKIWTKTQVIALYELTADPAKIRSQTLKHFSNACLNYWEFEVIEDQAWERAWMEHYRPMKFADRLWVCPTGQEIHEEGTVCLTLDPGLAFGTGTHPTTALCLEWLANHDVTGKTVIDYGCGSGILAVAAVMLGAKVAYAVDIDPQAITATEMNAEKNCVQAKIIATLPEQFHRNPIKAEVVIANILAKPLIDMTQTIANLAKSGADIVLSGILAEQADSVQMAYQARVKLRDKMQKEEWIRLAGTIS